MLPPICTREPVPVQYPVQMRVMDWYKWVFYSNDLMPIEWSIWLRCSYNLCLLTYYYFYFSKRIKQWIIMYSKHLYFKMCITCFSLRRRELQQRDFKRNLKCRCTTYKRHDQLQTTQKQQQKEKPPHHHYIEDPDDWSLQGRKTQKTHTLHFLPNNPDPVEVERGSHARLCL
jgi:hypothetical protein